MYVQVILGVLLSKIFLKLTKHQSVSVLMNTIALELDLETLVCQMYLLAFCICIVFTTGCSEIAFTVKINFEILSNNCPNSNIEFSCFVKQWFFNILLDNPKGLSLLFLENKIDHFSYISEYFNASTLI